MRRNLLLLSSLFFCCARLTWADVTYHFAVDTLSIDGTAGSLDFNFNPGPLVSQSASLQILNFSSDGLLTGSPVLTGDVAGTLPGTLTFDNGTPLNDYFQDFTFKSTLSFDARLFGAAVDSPDGVSTSGSTFAFSMFSDPAGTIPTLTTDSLNGFAFLVNANLDGTTSAMGFLPTPEPTGLGVFAAVLLAAAVFREIRERRSTRNVAPHAGLQCSDSACSK
jgi:hypothetical protein